MIKEKMKCTRKKQFCLNWIPCALRDESSSHLLSNTDDPLLFLQRRGVSKKGLGISKESKSIQDVCRQIENRYTEYFTKGYIFKEHNGCGAKCQGVVVT